MTAETTEMAPMDSPVDYIAWLMKRAMKFHQLARDAAVAADARREEIHGKIGGIHLGAQVRDEADADAICDKDWTFKKHISAQQMYDRWAIREATMISAMSTASGLMSDVEYFEDESAKDNDGDWRTGR